MKKLFFIFALFFFVASLQAQEKYIKRFEFGYENNNSSKWRAAVGDTVTGVAAAAASLDTVYIGVLDGNRVPDLVQLMISTVNVNNQDTLVVYSRRLINNKLETANQQTDTLVGQGGNFIIELNLAAANDLTTSGYGFIFDGTKGADTDSTAYTIESAVGVFQK